MAQLQHVASSPEDRAHERHAFDWKGTLFLPSEESTVDCEIKNFSAGGAALRCDRIFKIRSRLILYIDGFGRFESSVTRSDTGETGVRFVISEQKRERLITDIMAYLADGTKGVSKLRRHKRVEGSGTGRFSWAGHESVACDVLDISLQGISLKTSARPPIGVLVTLGETIGRVVRYHSDGIAIELVRLSKPDGQTE